MLPFELLATWYCRKHWLYATVKADERSRLSQCLALFYRSGSCSLPIVAIISFMLPFWLLLAPDCRNQQFYSTFLALARSLSSQSTALSYHPCSCSCSCPPALILTLTLPHAIKCSLFPSPSQKNDKILLKEFCR
ncbi:hypothetical protein BJ095_10457 [Ureibacillus chungkukjangi]|uniref:Uncharacterized protein n=1 Tax=Ureibacillus chungkukjangi TaxID=1202712 RepID=A0A318U6H8_9BACL|nr:hypothetical protein BJ095_10457 [Ureibacillus chungkukjangi]